MQKADTKTVLVTGANGFIGSRLCRLLVASGYAVRIACRESSDLSLLKDIPYSKCIADITRPETLGTAVSNVDFIIHLAGLIRAKTEAGFMRVNQQGTLNLLNAVKNHNLNLEKFVLVSSAAAAGPSTGKPRRESDLPAPITAYGRSKLAGEETLHAFHDIIPITVIRPPAVYGPGDRAIFTLFDMVNKGFRTYMAGGGNRVQMVFVDDLARGIMAAMESDRSAGETYYIAASEARSVREMMDIMGRLMNKKGLAISIPMWLLKIIAFFSEAFFRAIGKIPLFSREKVKELTTDWELDVSKAYDHFGFRTGVDFPAGAQLTIDWYRREGWMK